MSVEGAMGALQGIRIRQICACSDETLVSVEIVPPLFLVMV